MVALRLATVLRIERLSNEWLAAFARHPRTRVAYDPVK